MVIVTLNPGILVLTYNIRDIMMALVAIKFMVGHGIVVSLTLTLM